MVAQMKYCNISTGHHLFAIYSYIYRFDRAGVRQTKLEKTITGFYMISLCFVYLFQNSKLLCH